MCGAERHMIVIVKENHALQQIFFSSLLIVDIGVMDFCPNHEASSRIINSAERDVWPALNQTCTAVKNRRESK